MARPKRVAFKGLVHEVKYDEDRGSYGRSLCGTSFADTAFKREVEVYPLPPTVVVGKMTNKVLTCMTCIAQRDPGDYT